MTEEKPEWWGRLERAKAHGMPRQELTSTEMFPCPWCGDDQDGEHPSDDGPGPFDCTSCGKEFVADVDKDGSLFTQGLPSQADLKYLEWKHGK